MGLRTLLGLKRSLVATSELQRLRETQERRAGLGWARMPSLVAATDIIVDVGAAEGTTELYDAFPGTRFVVFEPLVEHAAMLERLGQRHNIEVHSIALGSKSAEMTLHTGDHLHLSSLLRRTGTLADEITDQRTVGVRRLDEMVEANGSIGLKIDAEGYETEIIKGATGIMDNVQWVSAEVSLTPRFDEDRMFAGVYDSLIPQGFIFRDIIEIARNPAGDLRRIDAVFVRS